MRANVRGCNPPKECLGRARQGQRRAAEAIQILAFSPTRNWGYLAIAYSRAGRRTEAEKLMAEAPALDPDRRGDFQFALAFAGLRQGPDPGTIGASGPRWTSADGLYIEQPGI